MFNMFQNMDFALLQQLLGAVKDNFVCVKQRPHRGYSGSRMLDLLTHLKKTYTVITKMDWLTNNNCFSDAYTPTDSIDAV